jgi:hypothetical protein
VPGQVALFDATTTDPALPDFSLVWFEQSPPIAPRQLLTQTTNAVRLPGEFCVDRLHGQPNAIGQMFVMSCAILTSGAGSQYFFFIAGGTQRTGGFTLFAPLASGPALIARGERMVQALTQVALQVQGGGGQPVQPQTAPPRPQAQAATPPAASPSRNPMEAAVLGQTPTRPYVGAALLRAPLGALPGGDALLAYTRELLAPAFTNLTLSALSNPLAFSGVAPGLPRLTLRWWDFQDSSAAEIQIDAFGRELNGGCQVRRMLAERPGQDAYAAIYGTVCPTLDPPYQLWWLRANDRDRSRLLLVAAPTADAAALQAAGDRMLAALGMLRTGVAP